MGNGYWILVWDGWASGLNMVNPRLHTDDQGRNWWPCDELKSVGTIMSEHRLTGPFVQVLFDLPNAVTAAESRGRL